MVKKREEPDDLTFANMRDEDEAPKAPRKRKASAPVESVPPWQRVADECPCRVSAEAHKANRVRVHIVRFTPASSIASGESAAQDGIVHCVPKADIAPPWRTTDAYRLAELAGV